MSWFKNINIFRKEDGTHTLTGELDKRLGDCSAHSLQWDIERAIKDHFTNKFIEKYSDEIMNSFDKEEMIKLSKDAFKEKLIAMIKDEE